MATLAKWLASSCNAAINSFMVNFFCEYSDNSRKNLCSNSLFIIIIIYDNILLVSNNSLQNNELLENTDKIIKKFYLKRRVKKWEYQVDAF